MKEFFSKKWVFISSLALSAVFVIGLFIMLCVPQFYIGSYTSTATAEGTTMTQELKFTSNRTLNIKTTINGEVSGDYEAWCLRDGRVVIINGPTSSVTEEEFENAVEEYKARTQEEKDALKKSGLKVNMFKITAPDGSEYKNGAAVAFFVIDLVLVLVSLAGAGYATLLYVKGKKATPATEEASAETPAE